MSTNKNRRLASKKNRRQTMNTETTPEKSLKLTARELADAIYEIVNENDGVIIPQSSQDKITKVLSNYYNLECSL